MALQLPEIVIVVLQHAVAALPLRPTRSLDETLASCLSAYALVNSVFRYAAQRELIRTVFPLNNTAIVRLIKVLKQREWSDMCETVRIVPTFRSGRLLKELLKTARRITRVELDWEGFKSQPMDLQVLEAGFKITSLALHISPPTAEDTTLHLPYLEHLVLDTCRLFPSATAWDFPTLQSLIIRNCHFNRRSTLFPLHQLRHILFSEMNISSLPKISLSTSPLTSLQSFTLRGSYISDFSDLTAIIDLISPAAPYLASVELDVTLFKSYRPNEAQASEMVYDLLDRCVSLRHLSISSSLLSATTALPPTLTQLKVYAPKESDRFPSPFASLIVKAVKSVQLSVLDVPCPRYWSAASLEYEELEEICSKRKIDLRFETKKREVEEGFNPVFLVR